MTDDENACRLRALYRDLKPRTRWRNDKLIIDQAQQDAQWRTVQAEFARLYPGESPALLAHIISSAWTEERKLAGQTYDYMRQAWRNPDGSYGDV